MSSDCSDFLAVLAECGDKLLTLEAGKIRAEFLPKSSDDEKDFTPRQLGASFPDEPPLPDHVRAALAKEKEIENNLLPDEIDA